MYRAGPMIRTWIAVLSLLPVAGFAAESASFRLTDEVFNAGGRPADGIVATSAGFRITLESIGEGVVGRSLGSTSFHVDSGFVPPYGPAGEIVELRFTDGQSLEWHPEKSAGVYNLYRDSLDQLAGLGFGTCDQQDLSAATATDTDDPAPGESYFYLATAENRLGEEGTKGSLSDGTERRGAVCP